MSPGGSPLVSVVVPTYYRNGRLADALDSVAAQTHRPLEVLVVDGSGEGHARPVVAAFRERTDVDVTYVAQDDDEGPQAARSLGAERATGDAVQFLDDDDRLHPEKLSRQLPLLRPPVGVVYCGMVDEDRGRVDPDPEVQGDVLRRALEMRTFPCITSTMLVDADVLAEMLPLRHRHGADDTGTKVELATLTRFDYVDAPLVDRGVTDDPLSDSWAYVEGRRRVVETFDDRYRQFPSRVRRLALRETDRMAARKRLEDSWWSPRAVLDFARAAYHTPEDRVTCAAECLSALLGRPGARVAAAVLSPDG